MLKQFCIVIICMTLKKYDFFFKDHKFHRNISPYSLLILICVVVSSSKTNISTTIVIQYKGYLFLLGGMDWTGHSGCKDSPRVSFIPMRLFIESSPGGGAFTAGFCLDLLMHPTNKVQSINVNIILIAFIVF